MSLWQNSLKGGVWAGVAVGAGLVAAPVVIPLVWSGTRTLLKALIKGGFIVCAKAQGLGEQIVGGASDLLEEARDEAHGTVPAAPKPAKGVKRTKSH